MTLHLHGRQVHAHVTTVRAYGKNASMTARKSKATLISLGLQSNSIGRTQQFILIASNKTMNNSCRYNDRTRKSNRSILKTCNNHDVDEQIHAFACKVHVAEEALKAVI